MSGNTSHGNLCQIVDLCEAVAVFCIVKADLQSVLHTLGSLVLFFSFASCKISCN